MAGGRSGIRTHERVAPLPVFKTGALNHSAIRPRADLLALLDVGKCAASRLLPLCYPMSAASPNSVLESCLRCRQLGADASARGRLTESTPGRSSLTRAHATPRRYPVPQVDGLASPSLSR